MYHTYPAAVVDLVGNVAHRQTFGLSLFVSLQFCMLYAILHDVEAKTYVAHYALKG